MAELLLELFGEEIPARMQARAAADLGRMVGERLKEAGLSVENTRTFVTPRRLCLAVDGLPVSQPDMRDERRGPRVGAPEKALQGFLGSVGLSLDQLEERETPKGAFYFAVVERKGRATADVIAEMVPEVVRRFSWPKSMRWGARSLRWVRPLHSLVCLFDGAVVPIEIEDGIVSGAVTKGHRFHAPEAIEVSGFDDYVAKLRAAKVMLDPAERRQVIEEGANALAAREGLTVETNPGLLDEVTGLVEWPVPLAGSIDARFMEVPPEVLITSMRAHQKYFPLRDRDGNLAPRFVLVANLEAPDGGTGIVAGNERVLRARLHDAKFFWDQDRKQTLEKRAARLGEIVFHAKLGTVADKMKRVGALGAEIARSVPGAAPASVSRAAELCKADLLSGMVYEFPELQGIMGRYYAQHDGEPEDVADAIAEHYAPQGPGDACPTKPVSVALSLADKLDTLAGFWAIDDKPTGSKDPFALRRAALGVIRLILENTLRLPLATVLERALAGYETLVPAGDGAAIAGDLIGFIADRLKVHLRESGLRHDVVSAVFAVGGGGDLVRLVACAEALKTFLDSDDGANLLAAFKRATNIVRIEEKKDGVGYAAELDASLLSQDEERALHARLSETAPEISARLSDEDFTGAMRALARLRVPVDDFFDHVTVNAENADLRRNRLCLLSRIPTALISVADFSLLEG